MAHRFLLWRDKLLLAALAFFFLDNSSYLRVVLRSALEGPGFQWGYFAGLTRDGDIAMVRGHGLLGHAEYIFAQAFIVLLLLVLGLRRPDRLFAGALFVWTSVSLCITVWVMLGSREPITVSRDTLGVVAAPADWGMIAWPAAAWLAATALFAREIFAPRAQAATAWTPTNNLLLLGGAAALVASAALLNLGAQHGAADFTGIGLIYLALMFLALGASPWARRVAA